MKSLQEFTEYFEPVFSESVTHLIERSVGRGGSPHLHDQIRYISLLAKKGKRFRPYMIYSAYTLSGGKEDTQDILIAIELLHLFALIHDDIMDKSDVRHSVPTIHVYSENMYTEQGDDDAKNRGIAQAILLGDLVFAWSIEFFNKGITHTTKEIQQKMHAVYATLLEEVIVGQMIDVDISALDIAPVAMVEQKNILKTAQYTFVRPLSLGAVLAGAQETVCARYEKIGTLLGVAFQAQDDLLDIYGTESGKPLCVDVALGQQTLVSAYMTQADSVYKDVFFGAYRKTLKSGDIEKIQDVVERSGVRARITTRIETAFNDIRIHIQNTSKEEQLFWEGCLTLLEKRTK